MSEGLKIEDSAKPNKFEVIIVTEIGTCKDCKWWERHSGNVGGGNCYELSPLDDDFIKDGIYAWVSDSRSAIAVGPDFGCIHWEQKK